VKHIYAITIFQKNINNKEKRQTVTEKKPINLLLWSHLLFQITTDNLLTDHFSHREIGKFQDYSIVCNTVIIP
jgi:hypothetical protein